ncbi:MAG TPA: cupin domain-containing protein [Candidatus Methylomirabilis sp.]|nr:cupin domain-containing protein [Candidatus Methylomirabilis sp.]
MDDAPLVPPPSGRTSPGPDTIAPDGSEIRLLATLSHGATRASLCEVRLAAGAISRPVAHRSVEEIWYVLEGRGRIWRCPPGARADAIEVGPGDAVVIPTGWSFQFSAGPGGPLRFLCFTSPPWPGADEARPVASGGLGEPTI